MSQFCTRCGTRVLSGAQFCTGCGSAVAGVPNLPAVADRENGDSRIDRSRDAVTPEEDSGGPADRGAVEPNRRNQFGPAIAVAAVIGLVVIIATIVVTGLSSRPVPSNTVDLAVREPVAYADHFLTATDESLQVVSPANLRDRPSSQGTTVLRQLRAGEEISGRWVRGVDPTTRWLRVNIGTRAGYIWERNLGPPGAAGRFSPRIVFDRGEDAYGFDCSSQSSCLEAMIQRLESLGARREALEFARRLDQLGTMGWADQYRDFGRVDLVGTSYPLRANTNAAWLLVNGEPEIVDVESFQLGAADQRLADWQALMRRHPGAFMTYRANFVSHEVLPGGGQRFIFDDVVATCRACEPLAIARFAFEFDPAGRMVGSRLLEVLPPPRL